MPDVLLRPVVCVRVVRDSSVAGGLVMAALPPVRTREEAEQDAEFVKGALMEAGRPDLVGEVNVLPDGRRPGTETVNFARSARGDSAADVAVFYKAYRLLFPEAPCFGCQRAWNEAGNLEGDVERILLACDHVLPSPCSSRPLPVGAEK